MTMTYDALTARVRELEEQNLRLQQRLNAGTPGDWLTARLVVLRAALAPILGYETCNDSLTVFAVRRALESVEDLVPRVKDVPRG